MANNITSKFLAGTGVIVTTTNITRVVAIHAYSTVMEHLLFQIVLEIK